MRLGSCAAVVERPVKLNAFNIASCAGDSIDCLLLTAVKQTKCSYSASETAMASFNLHSNKPQLL